MPPDYYQVLGVPETVDLASIKAAYRKRALECHPDRGGSHQQMLLVNEAFNILANPETRQRYNESRIQQATAEQRARAQADISRSRKQAEQYPRDWQQFESWADKICNDFQRAEYDANGRITNLEDTGSGFLFTIIGGALGLVLGMCLGQPVGLCAVFGIVGATAGQALHRSMAASMRDRSKPGRTMSPPQSMPTAEPMIIQCSRCGQQLRIPVERKFATFRCGKCQNEFRIAA